MRSRTIVILCPYNQINGVPEADLQQQVQDPAVTPAASRMKKAKSRK
ncbi:hypothetical protein QJ527_02015 [Enterococcus mundtii]|nr:MULTISPECIES: hypothetical protein [Enterococcus]MDK4210324.1 hypothetical protein [Enterococcus mundtii]MDO7878174.1 hypothetical protein [Enterococcus mundtii]MEC3941867.1 hypothetical protein [Enterococcus mundtii]